MKQVVDQLKHYLPPHAIPLIADWIIETRCDVRISRPRRTKLGDYRRPFKDKGHRISVNSDLNPYAFLLTLVHEFAHLRVWECYGVRVDPHGKEWKHKFRELMDPFLFAGIFPEDLKGPVTRYLENPSASSGVDVVLQQNLRRYDTTQPMLVLDQVIAGALFKVSGNRVFRKGERLRKRYKCVEIRTGKQYLIHPMCEVILL